MKCDRYVCNVSNYHFVQRIPLYQDFSLSSLRKARLRSTLSRWWVFCAALYVIISRIRVPLLGMLNATKGNKYESIFSVSHYVLKMCHARILQTRVNKLNEQVTSMASKIKELESALAAARLQMNASVDPPEECDGREPDNQRPIRRRAYGEGSGTLAINEDGVSNFHGDTAQSEVSTLHTISHTSA